jgi:hypothetical protein
MRRAGPGVDRSSGGVNSGGIGKPRRSYFIVRFVLPRAERDSPAAAAVTGLLDCKPPAV